MYSLPTSRTFRKLTLLPLLVGTPITTGAIGKGLDSNRAEQTVGAADVRKQISLERRAQTARIRQRATRIALTSNKLGGAILESLVGPSGDKGAFISPLGIASALNLLSFGAAGDSRIAFESTLNPSRMSDTSRALALGYLDRSLSAANSIDVQIASANALWLQRGLIVRPKYWQAARCALSAEITSVDFTNPDTIIRINQWSRDKTKALIPQILAELDPMTEMVLTNATYFMGKWVTAFPVELTEPKPFARPDGTTRLVPMMASRLTTEYASVSDYHAVALPYGGNRFRMVIVTARDPSKSTEVWRQLARQGVAGSLERLKFATQQIDVNLPRFRTEFAADLQPVLVGMGLGDALRGKLDYSRLANGKITSLRVIHKAAVEVNEVGTEAAAITAVVSNRSVAATAIEFNADRPFLAAVIDLRTGAILFLGYIVDP